MTEDGGNHMSAKQTILIVFLVVLLMAVLLGAIIINKYLKNVISSLHDDLAKLDDPLIAEDIDRLDKMDLAGASLERFSKDRKNYNRIFSEDVTKSLELLNNAAAANESYKLYTAYEIVKQVKPKVQEIGTQVLALQKGFMELLKFTRDNKLQLDALKKQYDDKRKYILSTSYDYSLALEALEDELHAIGCQFESVKNLTIQGDHIEAKRVLQKIRSAITKLEDELPLVKKTSSELLDIFPEQLTEISTTYKSMLKNKFSIVEIDICSTVKQLRNSIEESKKLVSQLKLKDADSKNHSIKETIDKCYDILTKEYKAKAFVDQHQAKIVKALTHTITNSVKLIKNLEHIDKSYELTHGELDEVRGLSSRIQHLNSEFDVDCQKVSDGGVVYSSIEQKWYKLIDEIIKTDERENKIFKDVDGLYDGEKIANASIEKFKQNVSLIYRKMERRNLPGKPDSFLQLYTLVVNEIAKTADKLDQVRINLEEISHELIQIQNDIDRLEQDTKEILDSADLVELTMQYSNKYANRNDIIHANKVAYDLYNNKYEYKEALDILAAAIEKVEPGSYKRIESDYYKK